MKKQELFERLEELRGINRVKLDNYKFATKRELEVMFRMQQDVCLVATEVCRKMDGQAVMNEKVQKRKALVKKAKRKLK